MAHYLYPCNSPHIDTNQYYGCSSGIHPRLDPSLDSSATQTCEGCGEVTQSVLRWRQDATRCSDSPPNSLYRCRVCDSPRWYPGGDNDQYIGYCHHCGKKERLESNPGGEVLNTPEELAQMTETEVLPDANPSPFPGNYWGCPCGHRRYDADYYQLIKGAGVSDYPDNGEVDYGRVNAYCTSCNSMTYNMFFQIVPREDQQGPQEQLGWGEQVQGGYQYQGNGVWHQHMQWDP